MAVTATAPTIAGAAPKRRAGLAIGPAAMGIVVSVRVSGPRLSPRQIHPAEVRCSIADEALSHDSVVRAAWASPLTVRPTRVVRTTDSADTWFVSIEGALPDEFVGSLPEPRRTLHRRAVEVIARHQRTRAPYALVLRNYGVVQLFGGTAERLGDVFENVQIWAGRRTGRTPSSTTTSPPAGSFPTQARR
jgi:hypothetical protein